MAEIKQTIVPHLWFDKEAKEAANFYCSVFPDSRITSITTLHDTPSGDWNVLSRSRFSASRLWLSAPGLYSNSMSPFPSWCIAIHKKK